MTKPRASRIVELEMRWAALVCILNVGFHRAFIGCSRWDDPLYYIGAPSLIGRPHD